MILLETARLVIRNPMERDIDVIYEYRNHPACARYQRGQTKDREGIAGLVNQYAQTELSASEPVLLVVEEKDRNDILGEIVVMPSEQTFSFGYTISYRHHRRGYAFEALSALMEKLHEAYPHWEFICFTDPENTASMQLLRKLGFEDLGYLPSRTSQIFGKFVKSETYAEIEDARRAGIK